VNWPDKAKGAAPLPDRQAFSYLSTFTLSPKPIPVYTRDFTRGYSLGGFPP